MSDDTTAPKVGDRRVDHTNYHVHEWDGEKWVDLDAKTIKPGDVVHNSPILGPFDSDGEYWELTRRCKSDERRRWRYEFAARAMQGILSNKNVSPLDPSDDLISDVAYDAADYADRLLSWLGDLEQTAPTETK